MNPLYINLSKKASINYLRLALGIIMMAATVYIHFQTNITRFEPYHLVLLFAFGAYYTVMGAGINLLSFFTKAFILVDDEKLCIKPSVFKKQAEANWSDISEIQINITAIRVKLKNQSEFQFEYQFLDDDMIHTLKAAIIHQAKTNNITLS